MIECMKCERMLQREMFSVDNSREDGHSRYCKDCTRAYRQNPKPAGWVRKTADMRKYEREYAARRRAENPEKMKAIDRAKYEAKMRRANPDWKPRPVLTEEEKAARKKARNRRSQERKTLACREDEYERLKRNSRKALRHAVAAGTVVRLPCEVCGADAEAHHPAYDRPLLVVWLCPTHHREAHAVTKTG